MARRRYAHYLRGAGDVPLDPQKPTAEGPEPSRAWLQHSEEHGDVSPHLWSMTIEHGMQYATNHTGSFADLVHLATQSDVTQYYVWSSDINDFVLRSRNTVVGHEA